MGLLFALALVFLPGTAFAGCGCHHHHRWYYSYPGDQVNRGDVYRHGPPENGGYRGGYYNGRYHDNTYYDD
jgi:hypothetical protein